ncbi:MAG: hypothetical protein ACRDKJ_00690 [Actinomycetota bacterium]
MIASFVAPTGSVTVGRRRRLAGGAVAGILAATLLSIGLPAQGAEATLSPSPTGYFTRTQDPLRTAGGQAGGVLCSVPSPDPRTCVNPAQLTGGTPQYPRKDNFVYVARILGNDDARGVIAVPLFSLPFGAVISKLTLDFYVENEPDSGSFNFTPDTPGLLFCLLTQGWAGQDAGAWAGQPFTDCSVQSLPKKIKEEERQETTEEGAPRMVSLIQYSVDLMPMAAAWAAGRENHGVMVLPTPDAPDTFEAAIRTPGIAADGMRINIVYEAGEAAVPPITAPVADDAFGSTGGGTSFGSTEAPPATEDTPEAPFTVAAPEADAAPASATVSTPWWVYLALPLGGAVLGAMSRGVAQPVQANGVVRRGPVSQLMDRRREGRGGQ